MQRYIVYILFMATLLISCEREITYDGAYEAPKLVLQVSLHEGDSAIAGSITRSSFFLDQSNPRDRWLTDGVSIRVERGDGTVTLFTDTALHMKQGTFLLAQQKPLQAGEIIRIQASHPDYETVEGCDTVVYKPEVTCTACVWDSVAGEFRIRLQFGENARFHGVMGVQAQIIYPSGYGFGYSYANASLQSSDPIFAVMGNTFSTEHGGFVSYYDLFFRADDAKSKEVALVMPLNLQYYPEEDKPVGMLLIVTSYSNTSYTYRESLYSYLGLRSSDGIDIGEVAAGALGVEETVQIYTNITNGFGIVEASSQTVFKEAIK